MTGIEGLVASQDRRRHWPRLTLGVDDVTKQEPRVLGSERKGRPEAALQWPNRTVARDHMGSRRASRGLRLL